MKFKPKAWHGDAAIGMSGQRRSCRAASRRPDPGWTRPAQTERFWFSALFLLIILCAGGCGRNKAEEAIESDANGYVCKSCELKFYTDHDIFAEHCPKCKNAGLAVISAFVCNKDGEIVLASKSDAAPICPKCRDRISAVRLPRQDDLVKWGAIKKTRTEVCRS